MSKVDYYSVLGLTKKATQTEIKQAYKHLALVLLLLFRNTIRIKIKINKNRKLNLPRSRKHTPVPLYLLKCLTIPKREIVTIHMAVLKVK